MALDQPAETANTLDRLTDTVTRYRLFPTPEFQAVARIEASLLKGARKYFDDNGFTEIVIPHLTRATGACENISTMFKLQFFDENRFLAQTGQLYLEVMTPYMDKVWACSPSFRAEPLVDNRHLIEFMLTELEFNGDFEELLQHIENLMLSMTSEVLSTRQKELNLLNIDTDRLKLTTPFRRVSYADAVDMLKPLGVKWGDDLKSIHEKWLVENTGGKPLFITHFPKSLKFFNMIENKQDPNIVDSADLLLPFSGEAVGAAEREHNYDRLVQRLEESSMLRLLETHGGSIKDFDWYLNYYKEFGGVQHSGCGMGMNRVTQFVLGVDDIRKAGAWPMNKETAA